MKRGLCVLTHCVPLQDLEIAAEFTLTSGVPCLLKALKEQDYVKVAALLFSLPLTLSTPPLYSHFHSCTSVCSPHIMHQEV